jgi:hypothetical protein
MKLMKNLKEKDFEQFGFDRMLEARDENLAKHACALELHAYEQVLRPEIQKTGSEIQELKQKYSALHVELYDRAVPVSDAAMLVHSMGERVLLVLAVLAGLASLAGNLVLFFLFGFGTVVSIVLALGATAFPLVVGHLAYEKIVARHKALQVALILGILVLSVAGLLQLGLARRAVVDKITEKSADSSYVNDAAVADSTDETEDRPHVSEAKTHATLGSAVFTMLLAADIALGLLAGLLTRIRADKDYAAWRELKKIRKRLTVVEKRLSEIIASLEIAKVQCMAGILRAQAILRRRKPPYYRILTMLAVAPLFLCAFPLRAQKIEHYEGILIDTSGSIARQGTTNDLFREYLFSTKRLLLTEPASSRLWVSVISTDSFGGVHEVLKGWTPESHGIFTDNLTRARRQLAASFEMKSSGMAPVAAGTDIIGGLWHMKALLEPGPADEASSGSTRTIWIFSDMMNETASFPMPALLGTGPERMLERAKADGLLVPLNGYMIYVQGASPNGLSPQAWLTVKKFWEMYFMAAGARLSYSAECNITRSDLH